MTKRDTGAGAARAAASAALAVWLLILATPATFAQEDEQGPGSSINGNVEVEGVGPPSERLEVSIELVTGGGSRRVFTDSAGTFSVGGLRPGTYRLSVKPPLRTNYAEGSTEVAIDDARPSNYATTIIIRPKERDATILTGGRVFSAQETDKSVPKEARKAYKAGTAAAAKQASTDAIAAYRKAIEITPDYLFALNDLGVQYTRLGRYDEAIEVLRRAIAKAPKSFPPHLNLGMALLGAGKVDDAAAEIEAALEIDPVAADALYMSGVLAKRRGDTDGAITAFRKAYDQGGADAIYAQFELGMLYDAAGQAVAAAQAYRLFLQFVQKGPQADHAKQRLRALAQG